MSEFILGAIPEKLYNLYLNTTTAGYREEVDGGPPQPANPRVAQEERE